MKLAKAQHRVVSLFDAPVVPFNTTIQICIAAMLHLRAECFPDRPRVGIVAVGGELSQRCARDGLAAAKEARGGIHVPRVAERGVDQLALPVNGPVQIAPLSLNPYIGLVRVPPPADFSLPFAADLLGQQRREAFLPVAY